MCFVSVVGTAFAAVRLSSPFPPRLKVARPSTEKDRHDSGRKTVQRPIVRTEGRDRLKLGRRTLAT